MKDGCLLTTLENEIKQIKILQLAMENLKQFLSYLLSNLNLCILTDFFIFSGGHG